MPKKKRRLDEFLNLRKKNPETVLLERSQFANRVFRFATVVVLVTFCLGLLLTPKTVASGVGLAIFFTVFTFLGGLLLHRLSPGILVTAASFNKFIVLVLLAVGFYRFVLFMNWSPLLVPLPMFAMIVALAYSQPAAVLLVLGLGLTIGLTSPRLEYLDELLRAGSDAFPLLAASFEPSQLDVLLKSRPEHVIRPDAIIGFPLLVQIDLPLMLVLVAGSLTAILGVRRIRVQSKPVIVGFYAGVVQALIVFSMEFMSRGFEIGILGDKSQVQDVLKNPGWAFLGGLLAGAIVTCALPFLERFFNFDTERRFLELADPSNELLRVLRERAPGTYQHTLNVSQLASNAAEAIGGDRLLAEVGTYYHDIGKMCKPEYFVENMGDDKTVHERLRPSMSKMVIISHVKDGVIMAREAKLPQKVIDLIPMHHGTTVVEFFYQKARKAADGDESVPSETEYRYPGPKPRFREAGILMLADMVEAIAKTEAEPNPSRFRIMVHGEILKRLLDGQLDESDLTLNDLRVIEDSFVRTLTTMYHSRIKYPMPESDKKDIREGSRERSATNGSPVGVVRKSAAL